MYFIGVAQLQLYDYSTLPLLCFTSLASSCKQNNICISVPRGYYIMHFAEVIYYRWHLKEQNHIFFFAVPQVRIFQQPERDECVLNLFDVFQFYI